MKKFRNLFFVFILSIFANHSYAQFSTYHEIGGTIGPTLFNGDWGKEANYQYYLNVSGVEANIFHNMQFIRTRLAIRNNLGYSYIKSAHKNWDEVEGVEDAFDAMTGTTQMITLGSQGEVSFRDFGIYYPRSTWTPYVSAGFNVHYYMPTVESDMAFPAYYNPRDGHEGIINDSGFAFALKGSVGARFKLTRFVYVFGEFTVQRSFSDKIDGLETASGYTDYVNSFNIGIMYNLY
ncbi:MAG: hypothetical protein ABFR62_00395 [Bacteroidota bacterium]